MNINAMRGLLLLASGIVGAFTTATPAVAQESLLDSIRLGFLFGLSAGRARVDPDPRDLFTDSSGLGFALGVSVEKPLSKHLHLFSELNVIRISDFSIFNGDVEGSTGSLLSLGVVLGDIETPWRPYLSASIGYSYIDIGDSGTNLSEDDDSSCSLFICVGPDPGGHAKGLGYRVAVGLAFSERGRFELAHISLDGSDGSFPSGMDGEFGAVYLGVQFRL